VGHKPYNEWPWPLATTRAHYLRYAEWSKPPACERLLTERRLGRRPVSIASASLRVYGQDEAPSSSPFRLIPRVLHLEEWNRLESGLKHASARYRLHSRHLHTTNLKAG